MKILIDDAVFANAELATSLLRLFHLSLAQRHRIIIDESGSAFKRWLSARGRDDQEECKFAIEESVEAESREPARRALRVVQRETDWDTSPPQTTVPEALRLLHRPFRILVENRTNDYRFLLAMANDAQRDEIEKREQESWLIVEHGGGISEMENFVRECKKDPIKILTLWVLFDSDAKLPGKPSSQARGLRGACGRRVPHHMLARRTIENYVTQSALEAWGEEKNIQERVKAFYAMPTQDHRSFFNMKHGLKRDAESAEGIAQDLYGPQALDPSLQEQLEMGFGPRLRDVFGSGVVRTADLIAEGTFAEMNGAVTDLLAWMR